MVVRLSRSLNRKGMKGTKGKKDPEGIETSAPRTLTATAMIEKGSRVRDRCADL
jgi:hypothetical protein